MGKIKDRLAHGWDAFINGRDEPESFRNGGRGFMEEVSFGGRSPGAMRVRTSNERSIIASIYTRIAIDFASVSMRHVRLDDDERFSETIQSGLNNCLRVEANIDQAGRMFRQDLVSTLFDKGVIAVVPVRTNIDPELSGGYDIQDMRIGTITKWRPRHVKVDLYNDRTGKHQEVTLEKKAVAIIENPLYAVMNEHNSTLQRLIRKLSLLDVVDEQSSSGKLDIIIQLPYTIKSETRRQQAEVRRKDMEAQLQGSRYGIAYADAAEKITQLNRPSENNLLKQVEMLFAMLYSELGITQGVMDGTADEATMLNYYNRTIEPLLDATVEEFRRKFLTKTARTQGQSVEYYRDPFKFVPLSQIAEIGDKFTRNEIASSNEMRGAIGWRPSKDPRANELRNSNMPADKSAPSESASTEPSSQQEGDSQNGS